MRQNARLKLLADGVTGFECSVGENGGEGWVSSVGGDFEMPGFIVETSGAAAVSLQ